MEKDTVSKSEICLMEGETIGEVQIADDVVVLIAALAATEVRGVYALAGNVTNAMMSKTGRKNLSKGVKVDVSEGNVTVEMELVLDYGFNIPATCKKVQVKVKTAIENMTGLNCTDVNVRIDGVRMLTNGSTSRK
ncbi:MAG: Asp23/Gls24 family envelope stress response protein [Clostridium sp.]|nr:Asp23/Gls24 family envelope stress response protein [Clostridium sp.]